MKTYTIDGNKVVEYMFESLTEFADYIQTAQTSSKFSTRELESQREDTKYPSFSQALRLCREGSRGNLNKQLALKKKLDKSLLLPTIRLQRTKGVSGFVPSIPDVLVGNPINMWGFRGQEVFDTINIYVDLYCPYNVTEKQVENRGIIVQSIVDALQHKGYSVNLIGYHAAYVNNEVLISYYMLKHATERLNVQKTYFPLCDVSFVRRLIFRLIEQAPLDHNWFLSYGKPVDDRFFRMVAKLRKENLVIPEPNELGIKGVNIDEDLNIALSYLKLDKNLKKLI